MTHSFSDMRVVQLLASGETVVLMLFFGISLRARASTQRERKWGRVGMEGPALGASCPESQEGQPPGASPASPGV